MILVLTIIILSNDNYSGSFGMIIEMKIDNNIFSDNNILKTEWLVFSIMNEWDFVLEVYLN